MKTTKITHRSLYSWVFGSNTKLQSGLLILVLLTVITRVFPLEMQKRIINDAIGMGDGQRLMLYCGLYIGAVVLAGVFKYAMNLVQGYIGQRTMAALRSSLAEHILKLPMHFFRRTTPGHVISSVVQELAPVGEFIGMALSTPLVNIGTFVAMAGYMFYLNPVMAAISIAIYPLDLAVLPFLQRRFNRHNRDRLQRMRLMSAVLGETVTGIHEVHGNASVPLEKKKFSFHVNKLYRTNLIWTAYKFGIKFISNFFQSLGPFLLFLVGGWMAINGRFDLGALVAFLSAYEKLYDPWRELVGFYQTWQDSKVRYEQVMQTFDLEPDYELAPQGRAPYSLTGDISLQNVSYEVPGNILLLDDISLRIPAGEHLAVVGFSGSGKSTLALIIARLYSHSRGTVTFDGHDVQSLSRQDLVFNMGIVPQSPFIFDGTVRENLLYSCQSVIEQGGSCGDYEGEPDLDRIIEVVQQTGLFLDILRFGLRATVDVEKEASLIETLTRARQNFQLRHKENLTQDIDFFEKENYLFYESVAVNIVFATPKDPAFYEDVLHANDWFCTFLKEQGLYDMLLELGAALLDRAVDLFRTLGMSDELFDDSPIAREEFDSYAAVADALARPEKTPHVLSTLDSHSSSLLLKLALGFIPEEHTLIAMPAPLQQKILDCRQQFAQAAQKDHPQQYIFYGTDAWLPGRNIQDNIIYGSIRKNNAGAEERINTLLMQLLIEEFILEDIVAMGLEFQVGSMGDRLSGGQRQKISLARAFLKEPPVLILDEATSALDNASQARIQNLLATKYKGKSTLLSVVHRLDTLKFYDRVAVLRAGRLIECDSYEKLLKKKGALYELVYGKQ